MHRTTSVFMCLCVYIDRVCDVKHYLHPEYTYGQSHSLHVKTYPPPHASLQVSWSSTEFLEGWVLSYPTPIIVESLHYSRGKKVGWVHQPWTCFQSPFLRHVSCQSRSLQLRYWHGMFWVFELSLFFFGNILFPITLTVYHWLLK